MDSDMLNTYVLVGTIIYINIMDQDRYVILFSGIPTVVNMDFFFYHRSDFIIIFNLFQSYEFFKDRRFQSYNFFLRIKRAVV